MRRDERRREERIGDPDNGERLRRRRVKRPTRRPVKKESVPRRELEEALTRGGPVRA